METAFHILFSTGPSVNGHETCQGRCQEQEGTLQLEFLLQMMALVKSLPILSTQQITFIKSINLSSSVFPLPNIDPYVTQQGLLGQGLEY